MKPIYFLLIPIFAFANNTEKELLNLQEDYKLLFEQMKQLQVDIEVLQNSNNKLQKEVLQLKQEKQSFFPQETVSNASIDQLKAKVATLEENFEKKFAEQKTVIIKAVQEQIESIAKQTEKIFESLAKLVQPTQILKKDFSDDYPQRGIVYTIKNGDTISVIAQKYNSSVRDIQNANRISNPKEIMVGQTLFIPQKESK